MDGGLAEGILYPPMTLWWMIVGFAVLLIGITKSGFGAGLGLMVVPLTALAMENIPERGTEAALGLLLPLLILGDIVALYQYRKLFSAENVKRLLPGTILGVIVGGLILWSFRQAQDLVGPLLLTAIGLECIGLVGLHWWLAVRGVRARLLREPLRARVTGCFSGVSSTLAHAAGPIITMYILPLRLDRRVFVGTCAVYFFLLNTSKLPAYWLSGQFQNAELTLSLRFAPLVLLGALFGVWINRRLSDQLFSRIVYVVTFFLGWYVLYRGLIGLVEHLGGT